MKVTDFSELLNNKVKKIKEELDNFRDENDISLMIVPHYMITIANEDIEIIFSIFENVTDRKIRYKISDKVTAEIEMGKYNKEAMKIIDFIKRMEI